MVGIQTKFFRLYTQNVSLHIKMPVAYLYITYSVYYNLQRQKTNDIRAFSDVTCINWFMMLTFYLI